jgi:hypothetical protein
MAEGLHHPRLKATITTSFWAGHCQPATMIQQREANKRAVLKTIVCHPDIAPSCSVANSLSRWQMWRN